MLVGAREGHNDIGLQGSAALPQHTQAPSFSFELTVSPGFDTLKKDVAKECQDQGTVIRDFGGDPTCTFVGVFDGHGKDGRGCARFASEELCKCLQNHPGVFNDTERALLEASIEVNHRIHNSTLKSRFSGTTACFGILRGRVLHIANVGDSRAIVARRTAQGVLQPVVLTRDHKPETPSERERIIRAGGVVAQHEYEPGVFDGPFRIFWPGKKKPGLAMARSLGDLQAQQLGVIPDAECWTMVLGPTDAFILIASDGLWEVFSNEEAVVWVQRYMMNPIACTRLPVSQAIVEEAQRRWTHLDGGEDIVVDDTSVLLVFIPP